MKHMRLFAFDMNCIGHINHGLWGHPRDRSVHFNDLDYWTHLAITAERGKFDGIFLADIVGVYDVYQGGPKTAIETAAQIPVNDPVIPLSAMALVTRHLGFGVTINSTYEPPFLLARRLSTLDHLSKGRIGWNIVTGYLDSAARSMGLETQINHDERYNIADEYMQVLYKLWEGSWDQDAVVSDRSRGYYADPAKVRAVEHQGRYFKVNGIHLSEPSPQRTPVLFQAGASDRGQAFAAQHAECIFIGASSPEASKSFSDTIRARAVAQGRSGDALRILNLITVVVGKTEKQAREKLADYRQYASVEASLAHFSSSIGIDLAKYADDEPIREKETNSNQSSLAAISATAQKPAWTKAQIKDQMILGSRQKPIVGSAEQVADELEHWFVEGGIDGFNLARTVTPESLEDFVELVVPILQERGLFKSDYSEGTFRQKLFGGDTGFLPEDHIGRSYSSRRTV